MGVAATHHAMLERICMNAFVSVVLTSLLTRALLVLPSSACLLIFCWFSPLWIAPCGSLKGDAFAKLLLTLYVNLLL